MNKIIAILLMLPLTIGFTKALIEDRDMREFFGGILAIILFVIGLANLLTP